MPVVEENNLLEMHGFVAVDELCAMTLADEPEVPVPHKPAKPIVGIIFPPPEVRSKLPVLRRSVYSIQILITLTYFCVFRYRGQDSNICRKERAGF